MGTTLSDKTIETRASDSSLDDESSGEEAEKEKKTWVKAWRAALPRMWSQSHEETSTVGALITTYIISGVPYYNRSIMAPKTLF